MKKILTTVAGLTMFALLGACGPAVDTKETKSATPASASYIRPENMKDEIREFKNSRDAARPIIEDAITHHENHVGHIAKVKPKVIKPKVHKVKKKIVKPKKVYKKTYKVKKKTPAIRVRVSGIAACIAKYESGGNPRAQNPHSSASGLYQFIDGTWNNYGGYHRAMYAPVSVQTAKFYIVWNGGRGAGNWVVRHKCGW